MDVVPVNIPCPVCKVEGHLGMMTHVDEIPYFGEHTQVTVSVSYTHLTLPTNREV